LEGIGYFLPSSSSIVVSKFNFIVLKRNYFIQPAQAK
jgi:hypothetical protein